MPIETLRRRLAAIPAAVAPDRRRAARSLAGLGAGALLVVAVAGLLARSPHPRAAPATSHGLLSAVRVVVEDDASTTRPTHVGGDGATSVKPRSDGTI
jgi:ferric-dicitrate binding protein FerR (iron transport regulator)